MLKCFLAQACSVHHWPTPCPFGFRAEMVQKRARQLKQMAAAKALGKAFRTRNAKPRKKPAGLVETEKKAKKEAKEAAKQPMSTASASSSASSSTTSRDSVVKAVVKALVEHKAIKKAKKEAKKQAELMEAKRKAKKQAKEAANKHWAKEWDEHGNCWKWVAYQNLEEYMSAHNWGMQ